MQLKALYRIEKANRFKADAKEVQQEEIDAASMVLAQDARFKDMAIFRPELERPCVALLEKHGADKIEAFVPPLSQSQQVEQLQQRVGSLEERLDQKDEQIDTLQNRVSHLERDNLRLSRKLTQLGQYLGINLDDIESEDASQTQEAAGNNGAAFWQSGAASRGAAEDAEDAEVHSPALAHGLHDESD